MEVKTYLNDLEIIHSGQAHVVLGDILKIEIPNITIQATFNIDSEVEKSKVDWKIHEGLLTLNFINYTGSIGNGIFHPWRIGTVDSREFYFTIFSKYLPSKENGGYFICNYVFYAGKEVQDGE
uniref:DUF6864 domain-containing function n=1 Tax=Gelidibacter sp. TaxID=2018083 RepID=UPI00404ACB8D